MAPAVSCSAGRAEPGLETISTVWNQSNLTAKPTPSDCGLLVPDMSNVTGKMCCFECIDCLFLMVMLHWLIVVMLTCNTAPSYNSWCRWGLISLCLAPPFSQQLLIHIVALLVLNADSLTHPYFSNGVENSEKHRKHTDAQQAWRTTTRLLLYNPCAGPVRSTGMHCSNSHETHTVWLYWLTWVTVILMSFFEASYVYYISTVNVLRSFRYCSSCMYMYVHKHTCMYVHVWCLQVHSRHGDISLFYFTKRFCVFKRWVLRN